MAGAFFAFSRIVQGARPRRPVQQEIAPTQKDIDDDQRGAESLGIIADLDREDRDTERGE